MRAIFGLLLFAVRQIAINRVRQKGVMVKGLRTPSAHRTTLDMQTACRRYQSHSEPTAIETHVPVRQFIRKIDERRHDIVKPVGLHFFGGAADEGLLTR